MTTDTVPQTVLFADLFDKPLFAQFNQEQASSDGGAILLKAAERIYGLVKAFAGCLFDKRAPDKTRHSLADLIGQRIFGIACGHPDCNDGDRLADDPIHKLLLDRDPVSGERLASQPTAKRARLLNQLVEGASMRAITRIEKVGINTVTRLLEDAGEACAPPTTTITCATSAPSACRPTRSGASPTPSKRTSTRRRRPRKAQAIRGRGLRWMPMRS